LIDRWRVSDEQALELISYEGKLPTTDRRPGFRLSAEQTRTVSTMLEVDTALAADQARAEAAERPAMVASKIDEVQFRRLQEAEKAQKSLGRLARPGRHGGGINRDFCSRCESG
jgi:hypothetical protein